MTELGGPPPTWRDEALALFRAALAAAEPAAAVKAAVRRDGATLTVAGRPYPLGAFRRVLIAGVGKAGTPTAAALVDILGSRVDDGVVIVKAGHAGRVDRVRILEAAHPVPDAAGVAATEHLLALVGSAGPDDLVLCPISGGGSALLVAPAPPLTLADKQALTDLLLRAGCTIDEINAVRKHCSLVKGGQLARAAGGATVVSLLLSDVLGNPLDVIASGPTVPDPTTYADALAVLDRHGLRAAAPPAVLTRLRAGERGEVAETPKPGDPCFARSQAVIVGSIDQACAAVVAEAERRGYRTRLLTTALRGEAREAARHLVADARRVLREPPSESPRLLVAGGETTVTVRGDGRGGRCQELALAAALDLEGTPSLGLAALATDGGDGPTDAAGAVVDGTTTGRIRRAGIDARLALERNDAYRALDAAGALVRTGPTGTNVNDIILLLVAPRATAV